MCKDMRIEVLLHIALDLQTVPLVQNIINQASSNQFLKINQLTTSLKKNLCRVDG